MMVGIAAVAIMPAGGIWQYRLAEEAHYSTWAYGPNTSVLPMDLAVVVVVESRWRGGRVAPGEAGVVTSDPPDEDSAYPDRLVSVRRDAGPHRGTVIPIKRICLRAR